MSNYENQVADQLEEIKNLNGAMKIVDDASKLFNFTEFLIAISTVSAGDVYLTLETLQQADDDETEKFFQYVSDEAESSYKVDYDQYAMEIRNK